VAAGLDVVADDVTQARHERIDVGVGADTGRIEEQFLAPH